MSATLEKVFLHTYTIADLHRQLGLLQECLEEVLYHTSEHANTLQAGVVHARSIGSSTDAEVIEQWGESVWSMFTQHNLADQISALKKEIDMLPTLILYVPVAFDAPATKVVGVWCRENVDAHVMIELLVNPEATGGCAFVYKDTYHDYSLHTAMKSNQGIVKELLTSYV